MSIFNALGPEVGSLFVWDSSVDAAHALARFWTGRGEYGESLTQTQRAGYPLLFSIEFAPGEVDNLFRSSKGEFGEFISSAWQSNPDSYYSYKDLKELIKRAGLSGRGLGLESHHLLEKRYAGIVGVKQSEIISVPLTPQWHRNVGGFGDNLNNLISRELQAMGVIGAPTAEQEWMAHRNIYHRAGFSEWTDALYIKYFKPMGINY